MTNDFDRSQLTPNGNFFRDNPQDSAILSQFTPDGNFFRDNPQDLAILSQFTPEGNFFRDNPEDSGILSKLISDGNRYEKKILLDFHCCLIVPNAVTSFFERHHNNTIDFVGKYDFFC